MASEKITYADKVGVIAKGTHINQVWDDDMNEVKSKHNFNANLIDVNTQSIVNNGLDIASLTARNTTISYTPDQIKEVCRRTLTPYKLVTYLPVASPFTTASIIASTPTKTLLATTQKSVNGFTLVDLGGGNMAYKFTGGAASIFSFDMVTGVIASTNNSILTLEIYKNGVAETGLSAVDEIGNSKAVNMKLNGEISLIPNDYIEIYLNTTLTSTFTFTRTSINICERN